jgi:hypothetical protein
MWDLQPNVSLATFNVHATTAIDGELTISIKVTNKLAEILTIGTLGTY